MSSTAEAPMDLDEARAAIDGWFLDRSVDDATALEAFRTVALSDRTTAGELGELRIRFVDYVMVTRGLDRASAAKVASVRMESWFASAKQAGNPDTSAGIPIVRAAVRVLTYAAFAAAVAWVVLRLTRGPDFTVAPWFWLVEVVGSVVLGTLIAYRASERLIPAIYALTPVALTGVLIVAGA
jgi:hypothetical protein